MPRKPKATSSHRRSQPAKATPKNNNATVASIPRLTYSLAGLRDLPEKLLAASNSAVWLASVANAIKTFILSASHADDEASHVRQMVDAIRGEINGCQGAIRGVRRKLATVRDGPYHFGTFSAPSAHEASIQFATAVLETVWTATDLLAWTRCLVDESARMDSSLILDRYSDICKRAAPAFAAMPDPRPMVAEIQWEAEKAACGKADKLKPAARSRRLQIKENSVFLDGNLVSFDSTPEAKKKALDYLGYLIRDYGDWISDGDIEREERAKNAGRSGARWDRVRNSLPDAIHSLIDTDRRKGSRLLA